MLQMAWAGRRLGHVMRLKLGDLHFQYCPSSTVSGLDENSWYLKLRIAFAKNKCSDGSFQSVVLNSEHYHDGMSDEQFTDRFQSDMVLQLHYFVYMQNGFTHGTWHDCIRCPNMELMCLALPLFRQLTDTGVPSFESVPLHVAQELFSIVAFAAGYRGMTAHGRWTG